MARQLTKADLPSKPCLVCGLPFTWRKKWENCWDDVKYCSERCRRRRSQLQRIQETEDSSQKGES